MPYDVINEFLAAQSNNQSLHYPPSTQMPIKCCDNQFIKAEKSRSAKFKRKRLKKAGAFTNVSLLLVIGNFFSRSADGSRLNAGHNMSPTNRERPTHNTNRERPNAPNTTQIGRDTTYNTSAEEICRE